MLEILSITTSFFTIIALGAITKYIGLFDEKSSQILYNFAFYAFTKTDKGWKMYAVSSVILV